MTLSQNPRTPRPSLRSIADACGVSYQTVSRIMNGQSEMHRPEMVSKVMTTASRLGYRRNLLARGMLTGRSMTVGVMLPYYINREFNTGILEGIQAELAAQDYQALIISVSGEEEDIKHSHQLLERRVDGVIFRPHPYGESDHYLQELVRHGLPLVSVVDVERSLDATLDFVGVDEAAMGRQAARYLLECGHRRIGFTRIGDARFDVPLQERYEAFVEAVHSGGGQVVATPHSESPDFDADGVRAILKRKRGRPTAFFCSVDDIGYLVIREAAALGLFVPRDLSVLGSSNYFASEYTTPRLSSFDLCTEEVGRRAAALLLKRIAATGRKIQPKTLKVLPKLVYRDSVGRLPEG